MSHKISFCFLGLVLLVVFANGCAPRPAGNSAPPPAPTISEGTYTNQVSGQIQDKKYRVSYRTTGNGYAANIDVDADGTVIVTGTGSSNNTRPDVKVSGEGVKFRVVNFDDVVIDEGAVVEVYSCYYVRIRNNAKVQVYSCSKVYALADAELLKVQGCGSVQQVTKPAGSGSSSAVPSNTTAPAAQNSTSSSASKTNQPASKTSK